MIIVENKKYLCDSKNRIFAHEFLGMRVSNRQKQIVSSAGSDSEIK